MHSQEGSMVLAAHFHGQIWDMAQTKCLSENSTTKKKSDE